MKLKNFFAALALTGTILAPAMAQETEVQSYPFNFVGVQGGIQATTTNFDVTDLITPTVGLQVGRYFTPQFGGRLSFNGIWNKGGIGSINKTYDYKYLTSDIDLLFNVNNIFSKNYDRRWNFILVAGLGLTYAWDNDDIHGLAGYTEGNIAPWSDDKFVHNFRVGGIVDYKISKHFSVNLEVDANSLGDRFNSKENNHCDWQPVAMLGLNYTWGRKTVRKPAPVVEPELAPAPLPEPEPAPAPLPEPEPAPVVTPAPAPVVLTPEEKHLDLFYDVRSSEISAQDDAQLRKLAQWCKEHNTGKITVKGYADRGTGNPKINKKYSEIRANAVKNALVNTYGIAENQIEVFSYGDTVQPFKENDKNRCVRIDVKEEL